MKLTYDVIIIGGGLVGTIFAIALAEKNPALNIAIIEHQQKQLALNSEDLINKVQRIYAISPKNVAFLEKLKVWPTENIGTINTMNISGDSGGNIILDQKLVNKPYLAKIVESDNLQKSLYNKIQKIENISIIYEELEKIVNHELYIEIKTNLSTYIANLIVGADGINSFVRNHSGIMHSQVNYDQVGIVANFECELPHNNTAYQWFNNSKILAYLPLYNNQISIVWATKDYNELLALSNNDFTSYVESAIKYKLGKLKLISKVASFPLKMFLLDSFYINRIALIGDAAHIIHPLAGQGLNLGFGDAILLADILGQYKNYQLSDISILAKYNSIRMPQIQKMQLLCHSLQRLFSSNFFAAMPIRNIGLNTINSMKIIKKHLIKSAISY